MWKFTMGSAVWPTFHLHGWFTQKKVALSPMALLVAEEEALLALEDVQTVHVNTELGSLFHLQT
jgi:hypothetical protein